MREIADKIPSHRFQAADAREVLSKQKASAAVLVWNDNKLQELMTRWDLNRLTLHLTSLLAAPPRFDKLVIAKDFNNTMIKRLAELKETTRGRIGKLDESLRVGDQNAVCDLIKDCGKALAFGFQCFLLRSKCRAP